MKKGISLLLAILMLFTLASCGKEYKNQGETNDDGQTVWYLGGSKLFSQEENVSNYFVNIKDTVNPSQIYGKTEITAEMLHGAYTLNNKEKDLKTVRKEIPFEEVQFKDSKSTLTILPTAVYFGAENVCNTQTGYKYGEYESVTDNEIAVLELVTKDDIGQTPCIYEVSGDTITFKQVAETSADGEPFAYETTGVEFKYKFELSGPYITFIKGESSLRLKAFCFTENTEQALSVRGYSLPDSPLIDELDHFSSSEFYNFATRRDGSHYDLAAYKLTDDGKFTVILEDQNENGETEKFVQQYAYIIQSPATAYLNNFGIILLDGEKEYYYTDDISDREARALKDQGTDISGLTEEEIEEIAEKKSDLFDDLYKEFADKGINVTINRSTGEIAMDTSVLFGGDSAVITNDGKDLLNKFLEVYTSIIYNEKYDGFIEKTMVEGHTAPIAGSTYESGLPLSEQRANNVKDYCLSSDTGIDTSKLTSTLEAVGYSNSKPVYNSNGEVDMTACRRVSFRFVVNIEN